MARRNARSLVRSFNRFSPSFVSEDSAPGGKHSKGSPDELPLDVSWIRVYVLLRATSQRISTAEVVADLARRGFDCARASVSGIMRGLERKGYLVRIAMPNKRRSADLYTSTARGRGATNGLQTKIRELFAGGSSGSSGDPAAGENAPRV